MSQKFRFISNRKKQGINFFENKSEKNKENLILGSHIELLSNQEVTIEGCKAVLEYKDNYIKLKLNKGMVIICGNCFDIVLYDKELITVKGVISAVEFCI